MKRGCEAAAHWVFPDITCPGVSTAQVGSVEVADINFHRLHLLYKYDVLCVCFQIV